LKADSIPEIVAKAKPAIVEIVSSDATGKPKALGTAFFISTHGLVVTNHKADVSDRINELRDDSRCSREQYQQAKERFSQLP
jgi:hypothetical protein